jgi:competence protein ComEC
MARSFEQPNGPCFPIPPAGVNRQNPLATLCRQRLPFLFLLGAAVCGIAISERVHAASGTWLAAGFLSATAFFATRRVAAFGILTLCVFGTLHVWQGQESQAARFARWVGHAGMPAEARGVVASEPRVFSSANSSFQIRLSQLRVDNVELTPSFLLQVEWLGPPPNYGDEVLLRGTVKAIEPPRNPGQFDFAAWLARRGIFNLLQLGHRSDQQIAAHGRGNPVVSFALRSRAWLRQTLVEEVNDPPVAELLVAMVLGDVSSLPQSIQEEFRGTGTFHLFSVSGLHVGMVAVLFWHLLKVLRTSRAHAAGLIIPMLFLYVLMTGLKAASVRSAVMASIVLAGLVASRRPILFNSLCAAGFLILLTDTNQLFDPGFQLSFSVVAAIMLLAKPLASFLDAPFRLDPFFPEQLLSPPRRFTLQASRQFVSLLAVSASAWLGSLPLTIGYFHLVSITALPANALAVPLSFAIMAVSMLSLGTGIFSNWLASIYNQTNWALAKGLLGVVHAFASLPGSFFYVKFPDFPAPTTEIVVFDFGAGGSSWVRAEGRDWLIDSGPAHGGNLVLLPFLRSRGLGLLDGLILTHGDAGHIGSAANIIEAFRPGQIIDSTLTDRSKSRSRLHAELSKRGIPKSPHRSGDTISLGSETDLRILYPPADVPREVSDDKSLVIQLRAGPTRILFLSDAGLYTEEWLMRNARAELRSDILIKGSPRYGPSGDTEFLDAVAPRVVIATASNFPDSEKISARFSENLKERGIRLFAQDRCGSVNVRIFPDRWEISAFVDKRQYSHSR